MTKTRPTHRGALRAALLCTLLLLASPLFADAFDFDAAVDKIDKALVQNPSGVIDEAIESCRARRNIAVRLYYSGQQARAERSLRYCFYVLKISSKEVEVARVKRGPTAEELAARAARETEVALGLAPDVAKGLEIYRSCAGCHTPEGWGLDSGSVPQIAGQHRKVVIKQLADIRAGNRDNVLMFPYASVKTIGGPQAVADVAGYIDTLEISVTGTKGPGDDLELGERLYQENCVSCHGANGEGDNDAFVPRIQAQNYRYLVRQFEAIRDGKRRNANPEMVTQIERFDDRQTHAVLDYVSRLMPPEDLQAPPGWKNPDFEQETQTAGTR
ncbi:MAG: c-type cytochrome [Myxococcota bacterium]